MFYPLTMPTKKPKMARPRKEIDTSTFTGRFAARLKSLREKAGMSVDELAERSGIPRATLFAWESADRCPVNEVLPKLAETLGVETRTLLPKK